MNIVIDKEVGDILYRVKAWPPEARLLLAHKLLGTLVPDVPPATMRPKKSFNEIIGLLKFDDGPRPTDQEIDAMREEEMMRRFGP